MSGADPTVVTEIAVAGVEVLSTSFVRIEFGGPGLADFGVDGPYLDQRIKLLFPTAEGRSATLGGDGRWYERWRGTPPAERGHLRTYSVREVRGTGPGTRLVVDFVLHLAPGRTGPAARWAAGARVGDRLVLVGPRRGVAWGGTEFDPGDATALLLAADETAVPAASRILEDLPSAARGTAFLEVPHPDDVLPVAAPRGVVVRWLPRAGRPHGELLVGAVAAHLGPRVDPPAGEDAAAGDIWETPSFSSSGEPIPRGPGPGAGTGVPGLYAWIAGESGTVTRLRRHLVSDLGVDRRQVAFMGYWRDGVAAAD